MRWHFKEWAGTCVISAILNFFVFEQKNSILPTVKQAKMSLFQGKTASYN